MKIFQDSKNLFYFKKIEQQKFLRIKGINNIIKYDNNDGCNIINTSSINVNGNENYLIIKKGTTIYNSKIKICGNNSKLFIQEGCCIKNSSLWIEDSNCQIIIGRATTIIEAYLGASEKTSVVIGNDCFIESHANVRSGDSHSIIDLQSSKRINNAQDVYLGNSVWLKAKAWILKGANIGNNCIISESSIVTKDIPDNSLVSGVPAEITRTRVTWKKKKIT